MVGGRWMRILTSCLQSPAYHWGYIDTHSAFVIIAAFSFLLRANFCYENFGLRGRVAMSWKHAAGKFSCFIFYAAGFLVVTILLLSPSVTQAVDKYWNVASGDWSDTNPCPWNPSPEPTSSDDAYIDNGGTATITQDGEKCSHLYLNVSGASGTVEMSDGTLSVGNDAYVGYSGTGTFTQTGGTNSIANISFLDTMAAPAEYII